MSDFTKTEIQKMKNILEMEEIKLQSKDKKKRRMKFEKKSLIGVFFLCGILIAFTMWMIFQGKDTTSLTILAGAGVGCIAFVYERYEKYSNQINLKHMDMNYIPDYDERKGIY